MNHWWWDQCWWIGEIKCFKQCVLLTIKIMIWQNNLRGPGHQFGNSWPHGAAKSTVFSVLVLHVMSHWFFVYLLSWQNKPLLFVNIVCAHHPPLKIYFLTWWYLFCKKNLAGICAFKNRVEKSTGFHTLAVCFHITVPKPSFGKKGHSWDKRLGTPWTANDNLWSFETLWMKAPKRKQFLRKILLEVVVHCHFVWQQLVSNNITQSEQMHVAMRPTAFVWQTVVPTVVCLYMCKDDANKQG